MGEITPLRAAIFTILLLLATLAHAEVYGPILIAPRPGLGSPETGWYYEHAFDVMNSSADAHVLTLTVTTRTGRVGELEGRSSRTVTLAPRSSTIITVPRIQLSPLLPSRAEVAIDGSAQEKAVQLARTDSYASYSEDPDILVGRTVPPQVLTWSWGVAAHWVRAEIGPADWSSNWMQYSRFEGAILTVADWNELPQPVQTALLRWVSAGGSLTFWGKPEALPPIRAAKLHNGLAGHHGFGQIAIITMQPLAPDMQSAIRLSWNQVSSAGAGQVAAEMPLLEGKTLPIGALFSMLVAFAVVGGPLNLWALAKRNRRLSIFWSLPLLAAVTSVVLVGATFLAEGWVRVQRTRSVTLLDETRREATTVGWTGFYSTVRPDGKVRFDSATEARPLHILQRADTDWSDGQRFVAGWINSRFPSYFAVRKAESRRERLPVRRDGARVTVVNGLGGDIRKLWVATSEGQFYEANRIARGQQGVLVRGTRALDSDAKDVAELYLASGGWNAFSNHVQAQPLAILRPGMYIAVLERSPFIETAFETAKETRSEAVVVGWSK